MKIRTEQEIRDGYLDYFDTEINGTRMEIKSLKGKLAEQESYLKKLECKEIVCSLDLFNNLPSDKYFTVNVKQNQDIRPFKKGHFMYKENPNHDLKSVTVCNVKLNKKYYFHSDQIHDIIKPYVSVLHNTKHIKIYDN